MVSNVTDKIFVKSGEAYNRATSINSATVQPAGKKKPDSSIPLQIWQERSGRAMNILQERVRFEVDMATGAVVMETGSAKGGAASDAVTHPNRRAKGSLVNRQG